IPALAKMNPRQYGIAIHALGGEAFQVGDTHVPFAIESISKVFVLAVAVGRIGATLWTRVGSDPPGNAFNSLVPLEKANGIPRNPFINPGALVCTDHLVSQTSDPLLNILSFVCMLSNNPKVGFNEEVAESERQTGFRNAALINLMKSFGNIENDVDEVLK